MDDDLVDQMAACVAAEGTRGLWTPDKVVALCRRVVGLKDDLTVERARVAVLKGQMKADQRGKVDADG